jgi:chemotaxis family two-component system response regulator PixG
MQKILEEAGYQFIGIQDSIKALPTLIETKPDLIFLDLIMPIANGYEICTQIRRVSWLKETPVIILTGNDGIVDRVRAKMVGSSDFLSKPVNAEKVLAAVKKHLEPSSSEPQNLAVQTLAVGNG